MLKKIFPKRKISIFYLIVLVLFFVLAWYLTPRLPQEKLTLQIGQNFGFYLSPIYADTKAQYLISSALGTTLNLDWYKVCLINGSNVTLKDKSSKVYPLAITIFPIKSNITLSDLETWAQNFPFPKQETNPKRGLVLGNNLMVPPNGSKCTLVSASDEGFSYSPFFLYNVGEHIGPTTLINLTSEPHPLGENQYFNLGNTVLTVEQDATALWSKRIILIFLLFGILESVKGISLLITPRINKG